MAPAAAVCRGTPSDGTQRDRPTDLSGDEHAYRHVFLLLMLATPAFADSVKGYCERDGKRLEFSDGLAFVDARDAAGVVTTTVYLTVKPIDRAVLATCAGCTDAPGENTFVSPRGDFIEAQPATKAGWVEMQHVAGELDMTAIVNLMYLDADGVMNGLDGGNGKVVLQTNDGKRIAGTLGSEARGEGYDETDMTCAVAFDLTPGWPGKR